ncbi:MAG: hypothetical protein AB7O04_15925, partial [Hyphomonadaceae bacterium]
FQPMYSRRFDKVWEYWLSEFDRVRAGALTVFEREVYPNGLADGIHDDGQPPIRAYYRPWADDEATWFQIWETVSEGTPVTPPFETREELIEYLVEHGDFWDQKRGDGPYGRKAAEAIVSGAYAPSMIIRDGQVSTPKDAAMYAVPTPPTPGGDE